MNKELPTPEMLRELLRYETETGFVFRRSDGSQAMKATHIKGYLRGNVLGRLILAHRVVWAVYYGKWPDGQIDHINGDRTDNRIENLRDVTGSINQRNSKMRSNNTSGVNGVHWRKVEKKWRAQIRINGNQKHIGLFDTLEDAISARKAAEDGHGFTHRHGLTTMTNTLNTTPPPVDLSGHEGIANLAARLLVAAADRRREEHEHRQRGGYTGGV